MNGYESQGDWLYTTPNSPIEFRDDRLEGQEFLRLTGCVTPERAEAFVRAYGNTGLVSAVRSRQRLIPSGSPSWPEVPLLLALAPLTAGHSPAAEWEDAIPDVVRQALLMRAVVDAYRLARNPRALAGRVRAWERREWTDLADEPLLGPLTRAGITFDPRREEEGQRRRLVFFRLWLSDLFEVWKSVLGVLGGPNPLPRGVYLTAEGLMTFIAGVLQPAVEFVARSLRVRESRLEVVSRLTFRPAMLIACHLQAAETFARGHQINECGWERCLGAPERQGLFLFKTRRTGIRNGGEWQWKPDPPSWRRRRGDDYCSPECASAASSARQRERKREWSPEERWRRAERRGR